MSTFKFKTNIQCNGCIAKVTPSLNKVEGIQKWDVDITNPQKILTIESPMLSADELIKIVKEAGYNAVQLDN